MFIRKNSRTTKARSKVSEAAAAQVFGGRVQPASGALQHFNLKADVKSPKFLVDDKVTDNASYTLQLKTWRKLVGEAWKNRRRPAMRINFTQGEPLVILEQSTFQQMLKAWEKANFE